MSTLGDIMSTLGGVQYTGGYHEYTGGCSVHRRDTMSTPGISDPNEKKPRPNFEDFCSRTFCDHAVVYVGLWNIRQLVIISPSDG